MAFDACMMRAVLSELNEQFSDAKIERVLQPQNDEIDLVLHRGRSSSRLVLNAGPIAPRIGLSSIAKENPPQAPMFCMLLRKYFLGGRIASAEQLGFDRIAILTVACYDEMGFRTERKLVAEIMGKYANVIILDSDDVVRGALKIVDFAASSVRQVMPGLRYQIPAAADKLPPTEISREQFFAALAEFPRERSVEKFITSTYAGVATQIARELCYRATGGIDTPLLYADSSRLFDVLSEWRELLLTHSYTPTAAIDKSGKPIDYSYMDITYLGESATVRKYESFSELFDAYFAERDRQERINQRGRDLVQLVSNGISRIERKLALQRESLSESARGEEYKKRADLITANLYRIPKGAKSFECCDFYDESSPTVTVELDPILSASAYAQKLYKLYNKSKTARLVLTEQIEIWQRELQYLQGVRSFIGRAECEEDLSEIRDELFRAGYSAKMRGYRPPKQVKPKPLTLKTSGGYTVLVGKNNVQNEEVTFRLAAKDDIWFHTKDIPGSHVILCTEGREPSASDYTEAAAIAAFYSQANGDTVAVDYTKVKNIKKPAGAKPGFVIYKTNYTAFVKPMPKEEQKRNG